MKSRLGTRPDEASHILQLGHLASKRIDTVFQSRGSPTQRAATVLFVKAVVAFYSVGKKNNYTWKGCRSRIMALRMVSILRIQAVIATFFSLPRFSNCWYWVWITGL